MAPPEKIRVLIVDDITDTRESIRRMLQFDPLIEVIGTARTGKEAVDMSVQTRPDVVIMDINMPDMDGLPPQNKSGARCLLPRWLSSRCKMIPTTCAGQCLQGHAIFSPNPQ